MKKEVIICILLVGLIVIFLVGFYVYKKFNSVDDSETETEGVSVVATMQDKVTKDSVWCPTLQLVWNKLLNNFDDDVKFSKKSTLINNLNKKSFTKKMLSSEYYYTKYGIRNHALKEEIEKAIYEKFNQKSDILDRFDWSDSDDSYFIYTMLYRKFEFKYAFDKLDNSTFKDYEDVEYFGVNSSSSSKLNRQIRVLYYDDSDSFAIKVTTKSGDEVIFVKKPDGSTFETIYNNMMNKASSYTGENILFKSSDTLMIPYLNINVLKEYDELEDVKFYTSSNIYTINKVLQTIKFSLDENGGEVKSEATIDYDTVALPTETTENRVFSLNSDFVIFLKEDDKDNPYFAGYISNIKKYQ